MIDTYVRFNFERIQCISSTLAPRLSGDVPSSLHVEFMPRQPHVQLQDQNFHRTHGRVLVAHDHDALLDAEDRLREHAERHKGSGERQALKASLPFAHCVHRDM